MKPDSIAKWTSLTLDALYLRNDLGKAIVKADSEKDGERVRRIYPLMERAHERYKRRRRILDKVIADVAKAKLEQFDA